MSTSISIQNMSIEDKLQAMELLWDDLSRRAEAELSPPWHGDELARREAAVQRGDEVAEDWAVVRRHIGDATR